MPAQAKVKPISDILAGNLVMLGKALAKHDGVELASISRRVHGDPPALDKLSTGEGSISLRKYDSSMEAFAKIWPTDLAWPDIQVPTFRKRKS